MQDHLPEIHPRLLTTNFDAMLGFYRDGLGLRPARSVPGRYVSFDRDAGTAAEATALAILTDDDAAGIPSSAGPAPAPATQPDRQMVVLRVARVDDWVDRLQQHGGVLVGAPSDKDYGLRSAHFRDPDGNLVELQQY